MKVEIAAVNGTYVGQCEEKTQVCTFLGLPFGTARRWEPAREVATSRADRVEALAYGVSPWQERQKDGLSFPAGMSEECLNLNLYGRELKKGKKAVMVWIYGGSQIAGNNIGIPDECGTPLFDGKRLVYYNPDILLVVPNYRVGVFGSVNLSVLSDAPEKYRYSNNLARLDLIQCLKWIHKNIEFFGGDKNRITLFGQSAGSANITALLLMPQSRGLFRNVICESAFAMDDSLTSVRSSRCVSQLLFEKLQIDSIEEALRATPEELLAAQKELFAQSIAGADRMRHIHSKLFAPVVDDVCIPEHYLDGLLEGGCREIRYLGGTNAGEYDQMFAAFERPEAVHAAREALLRYCRGKLDARYGGNPEIIERFLKNGEGVRDELETYMDLKNDIHLRMGAVFYGILFAAYGSAAYLYYLEPDMSEEPKAVKKRCPHGYEIPILFMQEAHEAGWKAQIREAWLNFARNGVPVYCGDRSAWRPVDGHTLYTMKIKREFELTTGIRLEDLAVIFPEALEYRSSRRIRELCRNYFGGQPEPGRHPVQEDDDTAGDTEVGDDYPGRAHMTGKDDRV